MHNSVVCSHVACKSLYVGYVVFWISRASVCILGFRIERRCSSLRDALVDAIFSKVAHHVQRLMVIVWVRLSKCLLSILRYFRAQSEANVH